MIVGLALVAALVYGAADFIGGLASRKTPAVAVALGAQIAGILVLALAWPMFPEHFYRSDVLWGVAAGFGGAIGIGALYAALAIGRMGVVSPVTAVVGASVPVVVSFALGQRPPVLAIAGVGLAFVAVALVSANAETRRLSLREPGLALALLSGLAIGALYVFLSRGHADAGLALLATTRVTSVALVAAFALVRRRPLRLAPNALRAIVAAGCLDMLANVLYVAATRYGFLAIAAVLTSLYPASTVFCAWIVLHERLAPVQWLGVALAFAGVVLIAL